MVFICAIVSLFEYFLRKEIMSLETFTTIDLFTLLSKKESLLLISIAYLKISDRALAKLLDKILYTTSPVQM